MKLRAMVLLHAKADIESFDKVFITEFNFDIWQYNTRFYSTAEYTLMIHLQPLSATN